MVDKAERLRKLVAEQDRRDELESIEARFPGRWPGTARLVGHFFRIGGAFLVLSALAVIAWTVADPQFAGGKVVFAGMLGTVGFLSYREGNRWAKESHSLSRRLKEIHTSEIAEKGWFKTSLASDE